MTKATAFIHLYEETSLDQILSQDPEMPKNDYHFNLSAIISHERDFNIVTQKVDDFSTMRHCIDPWMYIKARLNKDYYIEDADVKIIAGEIQISNDKIKAGFDKEGQLTKIYLNKDAIESDKEAKLEDIFIKGCSRQLYLILKSTFLG